MTVVIWIAIALGAVRWFYLRAKKRQAIRACLYLQRVAHGMDVVETNLIVLALESRTVDSVEQEVNVMLNQVYGGDRGVALMHARLEGFRG